MAAFVLLRNLAGKSWTHKSRLCIKQQWHCSAVQPNSVPQCGREQTTPTWLTPNLTQQCASSQGHFDPCLLSGFQCSAILLWLTFTEQCNQQHCRPSSERLKTYQYTRTYSTLCKYNQGLDIQSGATPTRILLSLRPVATGVDKSRSYKFPSYPRKSKKTTAGVGLYPTAFKLDKVFALQICTIGNPICKCGELQMTNHNESHNRKLLIKQTGRTWRTSIN